MAEIGVVLMNIGTPSGSSTEAVQTYLAEFLTDKDVINAPAWVREFVFRLWIVPKRAPKSALKYQAIWTKEGSPLMVHSKRFMNLLNLSDRFEIRIGMRYGEPSLRSALTDLISQGAKKIILVPLYPQHAQATTGSSVGKAQELLRELKFAGKITVTPEFYQEKFFVQSWQEILEPFHPQIDHWLFSFHGLPVGQIKKDPRCYQNKCCESASAEKRSCYRAQCLRTAQLIAQSMGLASDQWSVSFQSRLGPVKWIEPYTDIMLKELAERGVQRLGVCAPAFVVDGLETLEELNMEGRKIFLEHGGKEFHYIPCLNEHPAWVERFARFIEGFAD